MALDVEMLNRVKAAEARVAQAEAAAGVARAEYHAVVRRLHLGGASLREIAGALGMSHQRVQQMVDEAGGSWWTPRTGETACSFCGRPPSAVWHIVRGPNVFICDGCVSAGEHVLQGHPLAGHGALALATGGKAGCSFCGKRRAADRAMVLGADVNVCVECVGTCRQILTDSGGPPAPRPHDAHASAID